MSDKRKQQIINITPFIILYVLIFAMHMKMNLNLSDDSIFATKLDEESLLSHMINLYTNVNGKILPDTMAAIFTYIPNFFFATVSGIIYVILAYSISYVLLKDTIYSRILTVLGVLYLPASLLTSAGYVATSTNYVWTSAMFLFSLVPVKMFFDKKHVSKLLAIAFSISVMYSGNQEQTCILLIMIYCSIICFLLKQKIKTPGNLFIFYMGILSILSFIFIMTAPGHIKRGNGYSIFRIPNWPQLDLGDKIQLGISTTIAHFVSQVNILYIILFAFVIVIIFQYHKEWRYSIIGMIPLLMSLFLNGFMIKSGKLYEISHFDFPWSYGQQSFVIVDAENYQDILSYLPVFLHFLLIFSIMISLYLISNDIKDFGINSAILIGGVLTRMTMAFSPTLFGSSIRTYVYLYFALIILLLRLVQKQYFLYTKDKSVVKTKLITIIMGIIFVAGGCYCYYFSYSNIMM